MFCPKCKSERAHRSHRRDPWEKAASLLAIYPYRCAECQHRFLQFRFAPPEPPAANTPAKDPSNQGSRATREWRRRRREFLLYGAALLCFLALLYFITRERAPGSEGS